MMMMMMLRCLLLLLLLRLRMMMVMMIKRFPLMGRRLMSLVRFAAEVMIISTPGSYKREWQRWSERCRMRVGMAYTRRMCRQCKWTTRHRTCEWREYRRCWWRHSRATHRCGRRIYSLFFLSSETSKKKIERYFTTSFHKRITPVKLCFSIIFVHVTIE